MRILCVIAAMLLAALLQPAAADGDLPVAIGVAASAGAPGG